MALPKKPLLPLLLLLAELCCRMMMISGAAASPLLPGMPMPGLEDAPGVHCGLPASPLVRVAMKHRDSHPLHRKNSVLESIRHSLSRDAFRLHSYKILQSRNDAADPPLVVGGADSPPPFQPRAHSPLPAAAAASPPTTTSVHSTVQSGATLGSGEYFMDVFIGTPPKHFSLVIDTGSDLTWVQCNPCQDCYHQAGPKFTPNASSSYHSLTCSDAKCDLIYHLNEKPCLPQNPHACMYSYWYGDKSNTTGDLALETFTLNLTSGAPFNLGGIIFGCGHTNEGLFSGAGGLLGLGKGPLSFPSQLHQRYGRKFSYCLEDRLSNMSVSSVLTFGEDKVLATHKDLQYTRFVKNTSVETFYYLEIDTVTVGAELLPIPPSSWVIDSQGRGGTIIDSGTTLTYFATPAYDLISKAFQSQISYPSAEDSFLNLCYDVSGVSPVKFPEFAITFKDGAVFKPPVQNYFIEIDQTLHTVCLAMLEAPSATLSILGNFLQQNMHILYDLEKSTLGFVPMVCSTV